MKFGKIQRKKKNAITANTWNLILAFAPNITVDSMKN